MRSPVSAVGQQLGEALFVGCVLASLGSCVTPRAIPTGSGIETSRSHREPSVIATGDSIGQARLGHGLDMSGKVPPCLGATSFNVGDSIHFSLWEVSDAPAGSVVRASVRDESDRIVWSEDKTAPRGGSYLSFGIGRHLLAGKYRADVAVGNEIKSRTGFEVVARTAR